MTKPTKIAKTNYKHEHDQNKQINGGKCGSMVGKIFIQNLLIFPHNLEVTLSCVT